VQHPKSNQHLKKQRTLVYAGETIELYANMWVRFCFESGNSETLGFERVELVVYRRVPWFEKGSYQRSPVVLGLLETGYTLHTCNVPKSHQWNRRSFSPQTPGRREWRSPFFSLRELLCSAEMGSPVSTLSHGDALRGAAVLIKSQLVECERELCFI